MSTPTPGPSHSASDDGARPPQPPGTPISSSGFGTSPGPAPEGQPDSTGGRTRLVWPALTIALALLSAVLAFLLLRPEGDEGLAEGLTTSGESAAATACEVLLEIDASVTDMSSDEGWLVSMQLAAAGTLGLVAEAHDGSYEDLREELETPRHIMSRDFSMDSAEFRTALEDARTTCEDRVADR